MTVKKKEVRNKWLHLRLNNQEYSALYRRWQQTAHRELSDYARRVLLQKPVLVNYRNASADEILAVMIRLKNELEAVHQTWEQALRNLEQLERTSQVQHYIVEHEKAKQAMLQKTEAIRLQMIQIYEQWSSK